MMKKYRILIPLLLVLCSLSAVAAGQKDSTMESTVVSKVDSMVGEKGKEKADKVVVSEKIDTPKPVSKSKLSDSILFGYILSLGAILFALFVCLFLKKKIDATAYRVDKNEIKIAELQDQKPLSQSRIIELIKNETKDLKEEIKALKEITEPPVVAEGAPTFSEVKEEASVYVSKIFYGVYSPRYGGIPSHKLNSFKDEADTLKIETLSETTAKVSVVESLNKTQFSALLTENVIDVQTGNPTKYEKVSMAEPGDVVYDGDAWIIKNKIKVNLV